MNKSSINIHTVLLSILFLMYAPFAMSDDAGAKAEVGVVTCKYVPGSKVNLLIHSSASFDCVFDHGGDKDYYNGEAGIGLGLDLQWSEQSTIAYTVMASTGKSIDWSVALNGTYTGGKASAALGIGVGAAVLLGGGDSSIALVPLALEGGTGVGASAGVGYLSLQSK